MSEEWGPWIEHDGAAPVWPSPAHVQMHWIEGQIYFQRFGFSIQWDYPGFFWRWRTVRTGWFSTEKLRVCDDPAYGPIIRYRIRRPRALRQLIDLAENPPKLAPAWDDAFDQVQP